MNPVRFGLNLEPQEKKELKIKASLATLTGLSSAWGSMQQGVTEQRVKLALQSGDEFVKQLESTQS